MFCQVLLRERLQLYLNKNRKKIINLCMQMLLALINASYLKHKCQAWPFESNRFLCVFRTEFFAIIYRYIPFFLGCTVFACFLFFMRFVRFFLWLYDSYSLVARYHPPMLSVGVSLWYVHYFLYVLNCLSASQDLYE